MSAVIRDEAGRTVSLAGVPRRILSLVPSVTETLFAVGAGDRVVGVSDWCNRPEEASRKPRVGGVSDPRMDAIDELEPEIVLVSVSENPRAVAQEIEKRGHTVYAVHPVTVEGALDSIAGVARLAGAAETGERLAAEARASLEAMGPPPDPPLPVFYPVWEDPLIAPGKGTFVADLLRRSGAVSVCEALGDGWPATPETFLKTCEASAVILTTEPYPYQEADRIRWLSSDLLPPRARGRVFLVDGERTNRPGPSLVGGVREIRRIVDGIRGTAWKGEEDASPR